MTWNLVGKFFHNFDAEGFVVNQGVIKAILNDEVVVVDYFEWMTGSLHSTCLIWVKEIVDGKWFLYDNAEGMSDAYTIGIVKSRPVSSDSGNN